MSKAKPNHKIKPVNKTAQKKLLLWFEKSRRQLPWRHTKDPYAIWISEVMLQQTTSKAVIPYYQKFLQKFPNINSLARANQSQVFELWAGLGYYNRAKNLILAAKELKKQGFFPKSYKELLTLPGFGPYTARAVSSLAFEEPVGVLDGNVIRFLSRFHALPLRAWTSEGRKQLQHISDLWVKNKEASKINQALMEIGSVICSAQKPFCVLCPVHRHCLAYKKNLQAQLPLKKLKKATEFWLWEPEKIKKGHKLAFVKNTQWPFLKGAWLFPGKAQKLKHKIKNYHFKHSIMNYQIFVSVKNKGGAYGSVKWFSESQIKKLNPSSLIKKVFECSSKKPGV